MVQKETAALDRARAAGCRVIVTCGDTSNADVMRSVIEAGTGEFGSLDGVVHGALVLDDPLSMEEFHIRCLAWDWVW